MGEDVTLGDIWSRAIRQKKLHVTDKNLTVRVLELNALVNYPVRGNEEVDSDYEDGTMTVRISISSGPWAALKMPLGNKTSAVSTRFSTRKAAEGALEYNTRSRSKGIY